MYKIISDGLVNPRNLLKYRNKSGWFVLAFFAVLALFVTIGATMFYVTYAVRSDFTAAAAACEYTSGTLVCADAGHDYEIPLDFFGGDAYFLPDDVDATSLEPAEEFTLVFQEQYVAVFAEGEAVTVLDLSAVLAGGATLDTVLSSFTTAFLVVAIGASFLGNIVLLAAFALMSATPLFRLRGYIRFGKAYTVLAFAATPFALVLTFHNILGLPDWALMALMVVSFRSAFLVIRELFDQAYAYLNPETPDTPAPGPDGPDEDETPQARDDREDDRDDDN